MTAKHQPAEGWFSTERLAPYMIACDDIEQSVRLYTWNADVSAAMWSTIGYVEVLTRNAMHARLAAWSNHTYGDEAWYDAASTLFNPRTLADITAARRRASLKGQTEKPGRVVAELSFGFWHLLVSGRYDRVLWRTALYKAFPRRNRRDVEHALGRVRKLRNRIGHHEPIHDRPLAQLRDEALTVAAWIDPNARDWIAMRDQLTAILARKPSG